MAGPDMGALSKKAGPLPIGVWVLIVVGGLGVSYYINKDQGTSSPAAIPNVGTGYGGGGTVGAGSVGGGGFVTNPSTGSSAGAAPTVQTNELWLANAQSSVVSQGRYSSLQVNSALRKFIAGTALTQIDQEIVNAALTAVGNPPSLLTPGDGATPNVVGYFRKAGDAFGRIYEFLSDGSYSWVDPNRWAQVQAVAKSTGIPVTASEISSDNAAWKRQQIGLDPYADSNPAPVRDVQAYYRNTGNGAIYAFYTDGTKEWLSPVAAAAKYATGARWQNLEPTNAVFNRPSIGYDPIAKPASQAPGAVNLSVGTVIPVSSNLTSVPLVASPNQ